MADKIAHFLVLLFCLDAISNAQEGPFLPNSVVLDVTKDPSTNLYLTKVYMGNQELVPMNLAIDLSASFSWISSDTFSSSSYKPITSLQCSMAKGVKEASACTLQTENPITKKVVNGELSESYMSVEVQDVIKTGSLSSSPPSSSSLALIPHFLVSSAPAFLLDGLGDDVEGVLGFGKSRISLISQVSEAFGFKRKFSLCLSSSKGVVFLGESRKRSHLSLMYTPLVYSEKSYQIGVKSMRINGRKLVVKGGNFLGGAKISTSVAYTTMESKLYDGFVRGYVKAALAMNMTMVSPVPPFGVCFRAHGGNVPIVDLVLQSEMVKWRILGRNSMVHLSEEVMCLGFLDGGLSPNHKGSIVLGGYQLEDNVLEFDLATSMLGFSSTLVNGAKFDS